MKTLRQILALSLLLLLAQTAVAQSVQLCDSSTKCAVGQDLDVGDDITVLGDVVIKASHEAALTLKTVSASVTMSGATSSASNLIPDGSFVYGCTARVTTTITGATSFKIGDGSDDDKWGATIALTAGTTTTSADFTAATSSYQSATSVVLTAVGGAASFSAGAVRVECVVATMSGPSY